MIRPLRRLHRGLLTVLLAGIPPALVVVLMHRPQAAPLADPSASPYAITVTDEGDGARFATVSAPASRPELLVYLDAENANAPGPGSQLLGSADADVARFALTAEARGALLLYSPALQRTLARAPLAP